MIFKNLEGPRTRGEAAMLFLRTLAVACTLVAVSEAFQTVLLGSKGLLHAPRLPPALSKGGLRVLRPASPRTGAALPPVGSPLVLLCAIRDPLC